MRSALVALAGLLVAASLGGALTRQHPRHLSARAAERIFVRDLRRENPTEENSSALQAYNWAGYARISQNMGAYREVGARWRVPAVSCLSNEDEMASVWIGFDGVTDGSVEQEGTSSWCWEGQAYYFGWYEMYPGGTVQIAELTRAGDEIVAKMTMTPLPGGTYRFHLAITDTTTPGNNWSGYRQCDEWLCNDQSAEWVVERPALEIDQIPQIMPLAEFGPETISDMSYKGGGTVEAIDMCDDTNSYLLAEVSGLRSHGTSFTTTWRNSF